MDKWVYTFGDGAAEGDAGQRGLLGGKGANLAEMCRLGLPVPPGMTITTETCRWYYGHDRTFPDGLDEQVNAALGRIGQLTGRVFGNDERPLLLSVRSGACASMPGMMDTVLNLGLNDRSMRALAADTGNERFAHDSYRRFIQMYANIVMGLDHGAFEEILDDEKARLGHGRDVDLTAGEWRQVIVRYKRLIETQCGAPFPEDPAEQLWGAIRAVFASWTSARAVTYRQLHRIPAHLGTAVNIQAMVFGNLGDTSATGVAFTRDPSTGENGLYGEFLVNAQGEDVVAGIRTPNPLTEEARLAAVSGKASLEKLMPEVFETLAGICGRLEAHYRDMQDIEFTIERGKLWMLQTRSGKRTARAALRIAVEMAQAGTISREEAIRQIDPASLDQLLHPAIDPRAERDVIATGLPASPGAATGEIVFAPEDAVARAEAGCKVILVRVETSPEDIHGMHAAEGILTTRGGMTSHAAVVARGMGTPCVSGAGSLLVDPRAGTLTTRGETLRRGDVITIDGAAGEVMRGSVAMLQPELSGDFSRIMEWADAARRMKVRANAETPADARAARSFGAEGIGLCRTEHMFFKDERINAMREMILARDGQGRRAALDKLLTMQRADFIELFAIMGGAPVTIRLLDPPLHEFLPKTPDEIAEAAAGMGVPADSLGARVEALHEFNPMLGHRGCRLAISYPEIAEMQARAIFEAAVEAGRRAGEAVAPEIMVPLVGAHEELRFVKARIDAVAGQVMEEAGSSVDYRVGTMIELPRAAMQAGRIAEEAAFFSFGTNDLTQTTFGISRDDAAGFLAAYRREGIMEEDPFVSIDRDGVGELIAMAVERGRMARPGIKLGICGEHGGDPRSIHFCESLRLDYVSCSPFRVPIARLAAAQAALDAASVA